MGSMISLRVDSEHLRIWDLALRIGIRISKLLCVTMMGLVAAITLVGCSGGGSGSATPTSAAPGPSATATLARGTATPEPGGTVAVTVTPMPTLGATATATAVPVGGLPDGPLLALSPASGTNVGSQAVLVRATIESGATARVNGELMEPDLSGDFFVAVAVGRGENVIVVEVTGATGVVVRKELRVTRS